MYKLCIKSHIDCIKLQQEQPHTQLLAQMDHLEYVIPIITILVNIGRIL